MQAGALVPDDLIVDMIMNSVDEIQTERVLLDGFPRTRVQAEALEKRKKVDLVLNLAVPTEEIVKRITSRWIHPASGRTYAYDYNPPKVEGQDDVTGEPLVQRDDDKPEAVRARLQDYDRETLPLLEYYGVPH
ncbi:Ak3 [Symbiodinium natans]|uniref:Ak3 protein n=1 Tax=Symbiodinium natans TaxID=878477 RepID=A0A812UX37_9DINO|nr:Ak3 [Symbiodinium natans]